MLYFVQAGLLIHPFMISQLIKSKSALQEGILLIWHMNKLPLGRESPPDRC